MVMNKVGGEKYYIIISLILGLIVLSLSLYFIFYEYFSEDDISWETCRQSIILRASAPELKTKIAYFSSKDAFPLKCKTEVVNIDYEDVTRAEREFSDTLLSCWHLFGDGDVALWPTSRYSNPSGCVSCARIHIDDGVKDYYTKNKVSFKDALSLKKDKDKTYFKYLKTLFSKGLQVFSGRSWGDRFTVTEHDGILFDDASYTFPEVWDVSKGDIHFVVSSVNFAKDKPSTFVFWLYADDMSELNKKVFDTFMLNDAVDACGLWEGVPA